MEQIFQSNKRLGLQVSLWPNITEFRLEAIIFWSKLFRRKVYPAYTIHCCLSVYCNSCVILWSNDFVVNIDEWSECPRLKFRKKRALSVAENPPSVDKIVINCLHLKSLISIFWVEMYEIKKIRFGLITQQQQTLGVPVLQCSSQSGEVGSRIKWVIFIQTCHSKFWS